MTLEKVKEALEDAVSGTNKNLVEYPYSHTSKVTPNPRYIKFQEALVELNTFIERLESEELVEKVAKAIAENERGNASEPFNEAMPDFTWGDYYKSSAKAAIKSIKDMI